MSGGSLFAQRHAPSTTAVTSTTTTTSQAAAPTDHAAPSSFMSPIVAASSNKASTTMSDGELVHSYKMQSCDERSGRTMMLDEKHSHNRATQQRSESIPADRVAVIRRPTNTTVTGTVNTNNGGRPMGVGGRATTRYGSKYEKAKLLGEWAIQVSLSGVDPSIDPSSMPEKERSKYSDPLAIAEKALADKTMPLGIRRFLPDGTHEDWFLDELVFDF